MNPPAEQLIADPNSNLGLVASAQHGLVTRDQAFAAGLTRGRVQRLLSSGDWVAVRRGVYRSALTPATWRQQALAACVGRGGAIAVSHAAAAYLHGLLSRAPKVIDAWLDARRSDTSVSSIVRPHRTRASLAAGDVIKIDRIPVTSLARTIVDLAPTVADDSLCELVNKAFVTLPVGARPQLARSLTRWLGAARPGTSALRHALGSWVTFEDSPPPVESMLEAEVLAILARAGVEAPMCQHEIILPDIGTVRLDFAWPSNGLALEVDGYQFHSSRASFESDRVRGNHLVLAGWNVLHVTATQVREHPATVLDEIERALRRNRRADG